MLSISRSNNIIRLLLQTDTEEINTNAVPAGIVSNDVEASVGSEKEKETQSGVSTEDDGLLGGAFALPVDKDNKATKLKICSFARPHMRAFHYSWWSFFIAFFIWFSIAPLLPEVRKTLDLSKKDVWTTNIVAVTGDIVMRFMFGAVTDKWGARLPMGFVLIAASIPTSMTGLVNSLTGLIFLRLFIGIAGSSFVMCQCWSTRMFSKDIVGVANGLVGGWGNVGGGVTQIVMGTLLFPLFRDQFFDGDAEKAWRTVCIVPAIVAATTAIIVVTTSEDCPDGNYKQLKKDGRMPEVSASASFRSGAIDFNTWLLYLQYACCFGVELTMNNFTATYFVDKFALSTESASAIASIFGFMNIFARGLGGFTSDKFMNKYNMRGRIFWQATTLIMEGISAEGSTYGIVPYVNPTAPGAVAGIVGAGGPTGAVLFGLGFRQIENVRHAYYLMASIVIVSGVSCLFLCVKGHRGFLWGEDTDRQTLMIPNMEEKDQEPQDVKVDVAEEEGSSDDQVVTVEA
ncbi:affinity nitrate transporter 2 [Seminavis robusta]|uniref:Affinity nitrate transporter 2 n=1 Tax=Seminavis robusta TaxID=568900 RepID=A0A9N8HVZ0_9STRA|nr:affinity nitrate transporter 2 [Seminavis robusta]|eukprot:Sro2467_g328530.1 affinity nitrate transporter 2 (514) ;mRNA; r:2768-4387